MSNEAHRYEMVETFSVVSLVQSLVYTPGDLYRPHLCRKPLDRGTHYTRDSVKAAFPEPFKSIDDALAAIREFLDPRRECVA